MSKLSVVLVAAMACGLMLVSASVRAEEEKEGKEADKQEVKVPLDQVPANIKAAAQGAVAGLVLVEAEKATKNGVVTWEFDGKVGEKKYEVKVDANGKVLKAEEEKAGDAEKDEKCDLETGEKE